MKGPRLSIALVVINAIIVLLNAAALWGIRYLPEFANIRIYAADVAVVAGLYYTLLGILMLIDAALMYTNDTVIVRKAGVGAIILSALTLHFLVIILGIIACLAAYNWKPRKKKKPETRPSQSQPATI